MKIIQFHQTKAKLLQVGIFLLIQLFAGAILLLKKLKVEKTKPTFIISVLKVEYLVVLVSSISNFFINKIAPANNWMSFSSSYSALEMRSYVAAWRAFYSVKIWLGVCPPCPPASPIPESYDLMLLRIQIVQAIVSGQN